METLHPRRLAPSPEKEFDHRHGLHEIEPEAVGGVERRAERDLRDVYPQDRRFSFPPAGPPQTLAKRRDRPSGTDLRNALDVADVDAEFQCSRRHRRGRTSVLAQADFDRLPFGPGEVAVMGEKLVRESRLLRERPQPVGVDLNVLPRAREQKVSSAAQHLEQVTGDGLDRDRRACIGIARFGHDRRKDILPVRAASRSGSQWQREEIA